MPILQNIMCKCAKSFSFWGLRPPNRGFAPGPHWRTSVPEPPDWPVFILGLSGGGNSPSKKLKKSPKIRRDRRTSGTNSWLDDTDKNVGPDLPLLFKLHEIWSVDSQENH